MSRRKPALLSFFLRKKKAELGTLQIPGKQQTHKIKNEQTVETNAKTPSQQPCSLATVRRCWTGLSSPKDFGGVDSRLPFLSP